MVIIVTESVSTLWRWKMGLSLMRRVLQTTSIVSMTRPAHRAEDIPNVVLIVYSGSDSTRIEYAAKNLDSFTDEAAKGLFPSALAKGE